MASLTITDSDIPNLAGRVALITGGASGIGLAAAALLMEKGATVHVADVKKPEDEDQWEHREGFHLHLADVRKWAELRDVFDACGPLDFVFANAGLPPGYDDDAFLEDDFDDAGRLEEPAYGSLDVNMRGVINTVKLAWHNMRRAGRQGSIVITAAAAGYSPEQSLPIYSATQSFLLGFMRALRHNVVQDNITINAVAPAAVITGMLLYDIAVPIIQAGLPVASAEDVGRTLVYAATARQSRRVDVYGNEPAGRLHTEGRWHGRVILQMGDRCSEIEQTLADTREQWFGSENLAIEKRQQAATDQRRGFSDDGDEEEGDSE